MASKQQKSSTEESDRIAKEVEAVRWLQRSKFCEEKGYYSVTKRVDLKPEEYHKHDLCNGTGYVDMPRDLHRSGGLEKCHCRNGIVVEVYVTTWHQKKSK